MEYVLTSLFSKKSCLKWKCVLLFLKQSKVELKISQIYNIETHIQALVPFAAYRKNLPYSFCFCFLCKIRIAHFSEGMVSDFQSIRYKSPYLLG